LQLEVRNKLELGGQLAECVPHSAAGDYRSNCLKCCVCQETVMLSIHVVLRISCSCICCNMLAIHWHGVIGTKRKHHVAAIGRLKESETLKEGKS